MMVYSKKWILVTGASSGLGAAFAEEFAKRGANLILVARTRDKLENLAKDLRKRCAVQVEVTPCDLSEPGSSRLLFEKVSSFGHKVFGVVNNAGFGYFGKFHEASLEKIEHMLMLNNSTLTSLTHLFLNGLVKERTGFIVNVASVAGYMPLPYLAAYAASKAYVLSFTTALWAEYKNSGVRILVVSPGATETGFFEAAGAQKLREISGKLDLPGDVVRDTFKALEGKRGSLVAGSKQNAILAGVSSLLPSEWGASLFARSHK